MTSNDQKRPQSASVGSKTPPRRNSSTTRGRKVSTITRVHAHHYVYDKVMTEEEQYTYERQKIEIEKLRLTIDDKDKEITYLKAAICRLQDASRRKDNDLEEFIGILKSNSVTGDKDYKFNESTSRMILEAQQRAANAERLAEERKMELSRLKLSSSYIKLMEAESAANEYFQEIQRLQAHLSSDKSHKTPNFHATTSKQARLPSPAKPSQTVRTCSPPEKSTDIQEAFKDPMAMHQTHRSHTAKLAERGKLRRELEEKRIQATLTENREKYLRKKAQRLSKLKEMTDLTRERKLIELDYAKRMRLAELEAECEVEENAPIRARRMVEEELSRMSYSTEPRVNGSKKHEALGIQVKEKTASNDGNDASDSSSRRGESVGNSSATRQSSEKAFQPGKLLDEEAPQKWQELDERHVLGVSTADDVADDNECVVSVQLDGGSSSLSSLSASESDSKGLIQRHDSATQMQPLVRRDDATELVQQIREAHCSPIEAITLAHTLARKSVAIRNMHERRFVKRIRNAIENVGEEIKGMEEHHLYDISSSDEETASTQDPRSDGYEKTKADMKEVKGKISIDDLSTPIPPPTHEFAVKIQLQEPLDISPPTNNTEEK